MPRLTPLALNLVLKAIKDADFTVLGAGLFLALNILGKQVLQVNDFTASVHLFSF